MSNDTVRTLPNGATIVTIDFQRDVVLADFRGEAVTWKFDPSNMGCYWGHYFGSDWEEAAQDFVSR